MMLIVLSNDLPEGEQGKEQRGEGFLPKDPASVSALAVQWDGGFQRDQVAVQRDGGFQRDQVAVQWDGGFQRDQVAVQWDGGFQRDQVVVQ